MIQVTIQPDATGGVDSDLRDGSNSDVNSGTNNYVLIGTTLLTKVPTKFRGVFRFDVSSIPRSARIHNATLTLATAGGSLTSPTFTVNRLTRDDWTELGVTWNSRDGVHDWTTPGGDYTTVGQDTFSIAGSVASNLVFDELAELVADAVVFRAGLLQLLVIGPEAGVANFMAVLSSDDETPANRPKLVVEYTLPLLQRLPNEPFVGN